MNLRRMFLGAVVLAAAIALPSASARAADVDIKRLAPSDAHTVVYAKQNPERAYQGEYLADAWKTFRDERIAERVFDLISSRAPAEDMEKFKNGWEQVQTALKPINLQALVDGKEFMMFNTMIGPFGHTVLAVRLSEQDAEDYRKGVGNLFTVFQTWSDGKVTSETTDASGGKVTHLKLPEDVPYQPVVACVGDLFIISTSDALLTRCVAQLQDPSAKSKFDDARLKESLALLPKAEDTLTFFDADQLFKNLAGIGDFIRAQKPGDEDADRGAKILELAIKEFDILEYQTVVEYTEDGQNRVAALGKVSDNIDKTILGRAITHGKPFENWQSWVPAEATAYSLDTGVDLHEIYTGVMGFVREQAPESHETLDQWKAMQEKVGVNLDEDILQSFTGENVSITLPEQQSVSAFKCKNPEKVRELLDRAIAGLKQIPQIEQQGLDLVDSDDAALEGFQEVRLAMLASMPTKPVIGFKDGWMIMASSPAAAKKMLAVRAGEAKSIEGAESLKRFNLKTDGEAYAVSYSDIGADIRAAAAAVDQFAMMAPMIIGAAAQGAKPEDMKMIQQAISLLPSISKVIRKFDFYEQRLSITRKGPSDGTYLRESVTLIRKPEAEKAEK
jgi:hypothetical protein